MSEGKVNWHFTCPRCGKVFNYGMFAGPAVKLCGPCTEIIYNKAIKNKVESFIDSTTEGHTIYFSVGEEQYSAGWTAFGGIDKWTIEMEGLKNE